MSGYLLTLVCLVLSVLILTMGPQPADTTLLTGDGGGTNEENGIIFKRMFGRETKRAGLCEVLASDYHACRTEACRNEKDFLHAVNCGSRKRTFTVGSGQVNPPHQARGPHHRPAAPRRTQFAPVQRADWR